jgi:polyisoprenoid-binding protein YceI
MCSSAPLLVLSLAVLASPAGACAQSADSARSTAKDPVTYVLTPDSRLEVKTGKSGLLGFAGHEHIIRANHPTGRIVYDPSAPANSTVEISVLTRNLEVLTPPDTAEIRKVTEAMRTEVLYIDRHPEITFVSKSVTAIKGGFRVLGSLTISGKTRDVTVDLTTTIAPDTLRAEGSFSVKQTDFGIKPYKGGPGGTVRVADKVDFRLNVVATSKS